MTTIQIHLLMLGLGLLAYLFLSGPLGNRKSLSKRLRRQWWLGVIAAIAVTASPLSRFWRNPANGMELLTQSLLIAAICLLVLMLFALLRRPVRALFAKDKSDDEQTHDAQPLATHNSDELADSTSTPIVINADAGDTTVPASNAQPANTNTTDAAFERSLHNPATRAQQKVGKQHEATVAPSQSVEENTTQAFASTEKLDDTGTSDIEKLYKHDVHEDQANTTRLSQTEMDTVVQMQAKNNNTRQMDDGLSRSTAANDNTSLKESLSITIDADEPDKNELDLSETEELFAELREQKAEVKLPNEDELRKAKADSSIDELDFDTDLIQEASNRPGATSQDKLSTDVIEEAEVVDIDEASMEFGNDLTGEYAHPDVIASTPSMATIDKSRERMQSVQIPDTLDAAIIAAKASALSLQTQVSSLENSITELDDLRDSTMDATIEAAEIRAEHNDALLQQKEELLRSENEARTAAESVIAAQSALIDRAKRDQAIVNTMLNDERIRLAQLQAEVERSRKMARSAANLARRAAVAQQESKDIALREQTARLKSQESTRKAVTIARNAISALAAEERKRGVTRH